MFYLSETDQHDPANKQVNWEAYRDEGCCDRSDATTLGRKQDCIEPWGVARDRQYDSTDLQSGNHGQPILVRTPALWF